MFEASLSSYKMFFISALLFVSTFVGWIEWWLLPIVPRWCDTFLLFYQVLQAAVSFIIINYSSVECLRIFISDFVALGVLLLSVRMGCSKLLLIVCLLMSW